MVGCINISFKYLLIFLTSGLYAFRSGYYHKIFSSVMAKPAEYPEGSAGKQVHIGGQTDAVDSLIAEKMISASKAWDRLQ
jgi:hypothetical protein